MNLTGGRDIDILGKLHGVTKEIGGGTQSEETGVVKVVGTNPITLINRNEDIIYEIPNLDGE